MPKQVSYDGSPTSTKITNTYVELEKLDSKVVETKIGGKEIELNIWNALKAAWNGEDPESIIK